MKRCEERISKTVQVRKWNIKVRLTTSTGGSLLVVPGGHTSVDPARVVVVLLLGLLLLRLLLLGLFLPLLLGLLLGGLSLLGGLRGGRGLRLLLGLLRGGLSSGGLGTRGQDGDDGRAREGNGSVYQKSKDRQVRMGMSIEVQTQSQKLTVLVTGDLGDLSGNGTGRVGELLL